MIESKTLADLQKILAGYSLKPETPEDRMKVRYGSLSFVLDLTSLFRLKRSIRAIVRNLEQDVRREQKEGTAPSHCGLSQKQDALAAWQGVLSELRHL